MSKKKVIKKWWQYRRILLRNSAIGNLDCTCTRPTCKNWIELGCKKVLVSKLPTSKKKVVRYKLTKCVDCKRFYSQCSYWSTSGVALYNDHNGDSPEIKRKHNCFISKLPSKGKKG